VIRRTPVDDGSHVKVTFALPLHGADSAVTVVGDFNDWNPDATPMRRRRGDRQSVSVVLGTDRRYAFRYRDRTGNWFDDDQADGFENNGLGGDNGIIDLRRSR
jgi:1,4-alpha-glucan branching enzyme